MARNLYRQARKLCAPVSKHKGPRPGDLYEIRKAEWIKNNPAASPSEQEAAIRRIARETFV